MSRPELTGHASNFYNEKEAKKYDTSSRMISVQREITERAIELLRLPPTADKPSFILDVGCGSGLSGKVLEEHGHVWVGCDVSRDMLNVANDRIDQMMEEALNGTNSDSDDVPMNSNMDSNYDTNNNNVGNGNKNDEDGNGIASTGDLMHHDMGTGLPFRPATFDACISISALQWLCYANTKAQIPKKRLTRFFSSLYQVLRRGGRAVLQFYPETAEQAVLISECAAKVGFAGGVVVDYPNSAKAKKHYLVLTFDRGYTAPVGLSDSSLRSQVRVDAGKGGDKKRQIKKKRNGKSKDWILNKKDTQRKKGKDVRPDTKYTGRKRKDKF
jgi:18S rRNA (guanine1575-N7)-methyltransferase